ncbi:MAG TPA: glycosyltransferase N-terminal domain-containing protein, partial [Candidatus Eisenbacteria bacterium]|nr:glycosyltransferase N-terminal domain-containing protein [Candidatus Eisenbacteria bacterium]
MSAAWTTYRLVAPCLGALAPAARLFASPPERALWSERLGAVRLAHGCHAWVHASSMGETLGVLPLVQALRALQPEASVHLTATTRGGRARLAGTGESTSLAPLDAPQAVARFFAGVRPARVLLVETELWPHWLLRARGDKVPVAIVSARLSERSLRRYLRLGPEFRRLVTGLAAVLCQSEADARRWRELGARPDRTAVTGNLKHDALPAATADRPERRAALGLDRERPLLVLGSVRPGEVRLLARAWRKLPDTLREHWQVVAVPRHPRASAELREEAEHAGIQVVTDGVPPAGGWRWDDALGVLARWYAASDAAFVGGSLRPYGGHNPLEPAACGAAVVMGPHHASQHDAVRMLRERGAITIARGGDELAAAFGAVLGNGVMRGARGAAARAVVDDARGAA